MKLSEAIVQLQSCIDKYGDLNVFYLDDSTVNRDVTSIDVESSYDDDIKDSSKIIVNSYIVIQ